MIHTESHSLPAAVTVLFHWPSIDRLHNFRMKSFLLAFYSEDPPLGRMNGRTDQDFLPAARSRFHRILACPSTQDGRRVTLNLVERTQFIWRSMSWSSFVSDCPSSVHFTRPNKWPPVRQADQTDNSCAPSTGFAETGLTCIDSLGVSRQKKKKRTTSQGDVEWPAKAGPDEYLIRRLNIDRCKWNFYSL